MSGTEPSGAALRDAAEPMLAVEGLAKHFGRAATRLRPKSRLVKAVDGVSFELGRGETLGVVGESGSGKSTVAKMLMLLEKPTSGVIRYKGEDVSAFSRAQLRDFRRNVQMVFQDPYTSLNARMSVGEIIGEGFEIHPSVAPRASRRARVQELLETVGLNPRDIDRHPHQFSGGQRQRIGIARALALRPEVLICDEPVSALDVSVQAQVINLLARLQRELGLSILFIAHDLAVVRHISDRVVVMYLGRVMETGGEEDVYENAAHPYTKALLSAVPVPDPRLRETREQIILERDAPSVPVGTGCPFRTRCWMVQDVCHEVTPPLVPVGHAGHRASCHFATAGGAPAGAEWR